jgi:hypothetical protein
MRESPVQTKRREVPTVGHAGSGGEAAHEQTTDPGEGHRSFT